MDIKTADVIFFSPTDTTKKIVTSVVQGMNIDIVREINLNIPANREQTGFAINADVVIIGVPVYGARIPKLLYPFFSTLTGNNRPAVPIAVYGNISPGFALEELYKILSTRSLNITAMGSFIGEHSFSTDATPIAKGRPDSSDLNEAKMFGGLIADKLMAAGNAGEAAIEFPESMKSVITGAIISAHEILPQRSGDIATRPPTVNMQLCNKCGICAKDCPMSAIDKNTHSIDLSKCIRCFRCAKKCPKGARKIEYRFKPVVTKDLGIRGTRYKKPCYIL